MINDYAHHAPEPRAGDWMQTFSGRAFWPLDPRVEDVDPFDIAHSLAHQCRYAGHTRRFYSVAEHCILMSLFMPTPELALAALLHDAAEAYVVDVPRPLKRHLPGYAQIDDPRIQVAFDPHIDITGAQLIPAEIMLASVGVDHPLLVLPASARASWEANPGPTLIREYTGQLPDVPNAGNARRFELVKPRQPR